jgi:hypothetical protein
VNSAEIAPLQGAEPLLIPVPRASPWAMRSRPFRPPGESEDQPHSPSSATRPRRAPSVGVQLDDLVIDPAWVNVPSRKVLPRAASLCSFAKCGTSLARRAFERSYSLRKSSFLFAGRPGERRSSGCLIIHMRCVCEMARGANGPVIIGVRASLPARDASLLRGPIGWRPRARRRSDRGRSFRRSPDPGVDARARRRDS